MTRPRENTQCPNITAGRGAFLCKKKTSKINSEIKTDKETDHKYVVMRNSYDEDDKDGQS